jgi:tRNA modification GTPase
MFQKSGDEQTICALSTPAGFGGIAVLRVSGSQAFALTRKLCSFLPAEPESHKIYYGRARNLQGEPIDEVLVSCFRSGRSFTGEETTEISCHGSPILAAQILSELVSCGARTARQGEFTYRAFMNGKLDLVQAESVLALIESESKLAARLALRQLQGELSKDYSQIEDGLIFILAQLEAGIDFSTEGIEVVNFAGLMERTQGLRVRCEKLLNSYQQGQILRSGLMVALVGEPNVGKSSLLNSLLGEDRAIVTAEAGTTRDTVEGQISINGFNVTFVDTAGIRETESVIEKMGIERSKKTISQADVVFYVLEPGLLSPPAAALSFSLEAGQTGCLVLNKVDLVENFGRIEEQLTKLNHNKWTQFMVSARSGVGLEEIRQFLGRLLSKEVMGDGSIVSQARHVELLKKIHSCLGAALDLMKESFSSEFLAFELQEAIRAIHELLGKEFDEQIIDRIFKEFCIGK